MKTYDIELDEDGRLGLRCISLVDEPAVEFNYLRFKKDDVKRMAFFNDDKMVVTGVSLLADTPIYRYDRSTGKGYYVVFSKEIIRELVRRYFSGGKVNMVNFNHSTVPNADDLTMVESYFVDRSRGVFPLGFGEELTDGSWITSFKVNDDKVWEFIKANDGGFSVEVEVMLGETDDRESEKEKGFDEWLEETVAGRI